MCYGSFYILAIANCSFRKGCGILTCSVREESVPPKSLARLFSYGYAEESCTGENNTQLEHGITQIGMFYL